MLSYQSLREENWVSEVKMFLTNTCSFSLCSFHLSWGDINNFQNEKLRKNKKTLLVLSLQMSWKTQASIDFIKEIRFIWIKVAMSWLLLLLQSKCWWCMFSFRKTKNVLFYGVLFPKRLGYIFYLSSIPHGWPQTQGAEGRRMRRRQSLMCSAPTEVEIYHFIKLKTTHLEAVVDDGFAEMTRM